MKKQKYLISLILMTLILGITNISNATITERYKNWQQLSDEEKQNTIQPSIYNINIEDATSVSSQKTFKALKENLETKYSLADEIAINVKNQENTGGCWTFSVISSLETNIAKCTKKNSPIFSTRHMEYATSKTFLDGINKNGYNREVGKGGDFRIGFAYLVNGTGPVLESKMPFENNEEKIKLSEINKDVDKKVLEYSSFANINKLYDSDGKISEYNNGYTGDDKVTYTDNEISTYRASIKKHIKEKGALTSYTYIDQYSEASNREYYNIEKIQQGQSSTYAYYCNEIDTIPNHAVTIVGWDDTYSKSNFTIEPKNDGAYIVLNSWGKDVLNEGYYYVSYDDVNIETGLMGVDNTEEKDYDTIYQHDRFGSNYSTELENTDTNKRYNSIYVANVFNRDKTNIPNNDKNYSEYINEVSVYVSKTSDIKIYINSENDDKTKIKEVATAGTLESGYHTVKLASPIKLTGDKFVVAARYSNSEVVQIPFEINLESNLGSKYSADAWSSASSNFGESFVSPNLEEWIDIKSEKFRLKDANVCVKAFTTFEEDKDIKVSSITLNKTADTMQVGDTKNLVATINPTDATNKKVTWKSSNEEVATISSTGIIKAIKEGTTNITVTTTDGSNKSATCKITVKAKTNSDDDKYKTDDSSGSISATHVSSNENKEYKTDDSTENINTTPMTSNKNKSNQVKDTTIANKILPNTGKIKMIISIVLIALIGIIVFIKFRKIKDIK